MVSYWSLLKREVKIPLKREVKFSLVYDLVVVSVLLYATELIVKKHPVYN